MVFAPGALGELGIAPRHAPLLTLLKAGEVRVQSEGQEEQVFYVGGGALEVQPHLVTVLRRPPRRGRADLDEAQALAAKQRAEEAMKGRVDNWKWPRLKAELARAVAQLRAIERLRKKR